MRNVVLAFITTACVIVPVAARQQPHPPLSFRAGTELIEVEAVVLDSAGHPVLDLTPGDFTIAEDGTPQTLDHFFQVRGSVVVSQANNAAEVPAASATAGGALRRAFLVVLDVDHLTPGGFKRAQSAAAALFSKHFRATDIGGVVVNGQVANRRLTSDREELLKAVAAATPTNKSNGRLFDLREWPSMNDAEAFQIAQKGTRNNPVFEEVVRRACVDDPDSCKREPPEAAVLEKAQRMANEIRVSSDQTLHTLAALMNGLERFEGRKSILLLSEGFVADQSWPMVQQVVGFAARANARIYSLDARGLDKGRQPVGNYAPHDDTLANLLASFDIGAESINSLAVDTGGYVVRNTNIFDNAIAEIADEAGTYYVLAYRSDRPADGKFHRITVKVNRPKVIVRARRGYVATPRPPATTTSDAAAAAPASAAEPTPAPATPAVASVPAAPAPGSATSTTRVDAAVPPSPSTASSSSSASPAAAPPPIRVRPNAEKHVETLSPVTRDPDADAGWEAYRRGDVEAARRSLSVAAGRSGAAAWVHYALGQSAYALRDFTVAGGAWEHVLSARPDFEPVYFDLVDVYLQQKDYDRATRMLRDAEKRWPDDAEVMNALGVVQVARGSLDDAVRSFQRAVVIAPSDGISYFNLAKTLELRYVQNRRWVPQTKMWVANEHDREDAIANYKRYLDIGGPFENSARDGLARLSWSSR